jgi:hypothetical protein
MVLACAASANAPAPRSLSPERDASDRDYLSPDGSRRVRVSGDQRQAVLVDAAHKEPAWTVLLAKHTADVNFIKSDGGGPVRISLELLDGSTAIYDREGAPLTLR